MRLDWRVVGSATASFFAIGYLLCVGDELLFGARMSHDWVVRLPGIQWTSWGSFLLGLGEIVGYGFVVGLVFAPLYNFFMVKVWKH